MPFIAKVNALDRSVCTCWDCVREMGLTPPLWYRDKHPRRYPHELFTQDIRGEPRGSRQKKDERDLKTTDSDDRRALRAAVRNREAI